MCVVAGVDHKSSDILHFLAGDSQDSTGDEPNDEGDEAADDDDEDGSVQLQSFSSMAA